MKQKYHLSLLLCLLGAGVTGAEGAALVALTGYTNSFSSNPTVLAGWSTTNLSGGSSDIATAAQLDAAMQNVAASNVSIALPGDGTVPPAAFSLARWNTNGFYIQSRANGTKATLLMATLRNDAGAEVSSFKVAYDFGELSGQAEQVPGLRVFYSLTGASNTWQTVPALSTGTTGALSATLSLGIWPANSLLYLLWGDDNATSGDGAFTIDNFSISAVVTIAATPVTITNEPTGLVREPGQSATFTVGASGTTPYYYAWYFGTNAMAGANGPSFTLTNVTTGDTGPYQVVVSNSVNSATSSVALLLVTNYPVVITNQPADASKGVGSSASFTVGVTGTPPFRYQWFHEAAPIANATNQTLVVNNAQLSDAGIYSVQISNLNNTVTSSNALLVVTNIPVAITSQPLTTSAPNGGSASFTVGVSGTPPFSFQWFHDAAPIANATNQTLVINNAQLTDGGLYSVQVSNVSHTVTSSNASLTVIPGPFTLLAYSNVWKYNQSNVNLGTAWKDPGYDDSGWSNGLGLLAVETAALPDTIRTPLLLTFPGNLTQTPTYYFRTQVILAATPSTVTLAVTNVIDDGAVFYVNGVEVYRIGVAAGLVSLTNVANRTVGDAVGEYVNFPTDQWIKGTNVLAVEVHQASTNSSDIVFGMKITATVQPLTSLSITSQPVSLTVGETTPAIFRVGVSGTGAMYQWFKDGTPIAGAAASTYTIPVSTFTDAGSYSVMVSNEINFLFSSNATLVVTNFPIVITNQPSGSTNTTGTPVNFTVGVTGATPYFFNWFKDDTAIPGATNQTYVITAPDPSHTGNYHVVVSNLFSSATSSVAYLSVFITVPRGPYLQMGTSNSVVIRWRTSLPADGYVRYGDSPTNLISGAVETILTNHNINNLALLTNNHIVLITNLQPDTKYYYSVGTSNSTLAASTNYFFVTPPHLGTPKATRLWVLGDAGTASLGSTNQAFVRDGYNTFAATNGRSDMILLLGDNAYNNGTDAQYQTSVFGMYTNNLPNTFTYSCIGNHETSDLTNVTSIAMLDSFTFPKKAEAGGIASGTDRYYSFDHGNIHFVVLDSMTSARTNASPMLTWLAADLAATLQPWIIAFWHHPPYSKIGYDSDTASQAIDVRQMFIPILESYGVDLVLSGHSHSYQRSFLINGHTGSSTTMTPAMKVDGGSGTESDTGPYRKSGDAGAVYAVAGSAGQLDAGSQVHPVMYKAMSTLGSMVIDIASNRLDAIFLGPTASVLDRFTIIKGPQSESPSTPSGLAASFLNTTQARLTWANNATNETGFVLERSTNAVDFTEIATLGANLTDYTNSGLSSSITYYFRIRATNSAGDSGYSSLASAGALSIAIQPQSRTNQPGETAGFFVVAGGTAPLNYQWRFNGANLGGQTGANLTLTNVQPVEAGPYTVRVSDISGSVTSTVAVLSVPAPAQPVLLNVQRLFNGEFQFTLSGLTGRIYALDRSPDLLNWTQWLLFTNQTSQTQILDNTATNTNVRFYRGRLVPLP